MFWKFDLNATSHVDRLLEKEDVTLRELMDEDDVLQECKAQNRRLVDFLCRQPCMEELVQLISREPPLDVDEKVRFKYPNTACELLTSDVPQISDRLGGDEALWDVLYGFLDQEPPLNPLLASFFSKTIGSLIARKAEQVRGENLNYINLEVAVKLKQACSKAPAMAPIWSEHDLFLTWAYFSTCSLEGLSDSFCQGFEKFHPVSSGILQGIEPRLKDFHQLLLHPPKAALLGSDSKQEQETPLLCSPLEPLDGDGFLLSRGARGPFDRQPGLSGEAFLPPSSSLARGRGQLSSAVAPRFGFFRAEGGMRRGNMGHLTRIANTVVQAVEKAPPGQSQAREFIIRGSGMWPSQLCSLCVLIGLPEDCQGRWESFVEETLVEANRRNTVDLVRRGLLHPTSQSLLLLLLLLLLPQAFSEYQVQQMTALFMDQFGFSDEEFADQDDNINAPFDRIAEINFSIDVDDDSASASLFETCCSERIQQFDDSEGEEEEEEEEDIWEENNVNYAAQAKSRSRLENGEHDGSMDSGEEEAEKGTVVHSEDPWKAENQAADPSSEGPGWRTATEPVKSKPPASWVATDIGSSVWDSVTPSMKAPEERGWAQFPDFQPFCWAVAQGAVRRAETLRPSERETRLFPSSSEATPRCSSPVENDSHNSEGSPRQSQDENASKGVSLILRQHTKEPSLGTCSLVREEALHDGASPASPCTASTAASPCAWNVCVARKAPLVASDSSSSGGSDSEEEEEVASVVTETLRPGSGQETAPLTVDAKKEKALFIRCGRGQQGARGEGPKTPSRCPGSGTEKLGRAGCGEPPEEKALQSWRMEEGHRWDSPGARSSLAGKASLGGS
ncbi:Serine/threonine-protein phosphatase 6 regulatory subunit 2, partial [Ophiophagus hannah]